MSDDLSKVGAITLTADQAAMLRKVLAAIGGCGSVNHIHGHAYAPPQLIQEARDALALLPEPVDADLVEARSIIADAFRDYSGDESDDSARLVEEGKMDDAGSVKRIVDLAHRLRTRALERDSREG